MGNMIHLIATLLLLGIMFIALSADSRYPISSLSLSLNLDRTISLIKGTLSKVEEQETEDLEEAQELAADAEQELRDAISLLEDVEIPNWLWLPEQGALYWHGPILDKATAQPVEAALFVNGHLAVDQVAEVAMLMWATEDNPIYVRVEAPGSGYKPWELRFKFNLRGLEVMEGPIWLAKEG